MSILQEALNLAIQDGLQKEHDKQKAIEEMFQKTSEYFSKEDLEAFNAIRDVRAWIQEKRSDGVTIEFRREIESKTRSAILVIYEVATLLQLDGAADADAIKGVSTLSYKGVVKYNSREHVIEPLDRQEILTHLGHALLGPLEAKDKRNRAKETFEPKGKTKALVEMTKGELLAEAKEMGLDVDPNAKKADILKAVTEAKASA